MKTFNDLVFKKHPMALYGFDSQAKIRFSNGYSVSVVNGPDAYCGNGTYEVAVFDKDNEFDYSFTGGYDVAGHQTPEEITAIMEKVQKA